MKKVTKIVLGLLLVSTAFMGLAGENSLKPSMQNDHLLMWPELEQNLQETFAGIRSATVYPIAIEHIEGFGYALHFYIGWTSPSPELVSKLTDIVQSFEGAFLQWTSKPDFNNRGIYISALPFGKFRQSTRESVTKEVSINNLRSEFLGFSQFAKSATQFGGTLTEPSAIDRMADFFQSDSIYEVILVSDAEGFQGNPTSPHDRCLHFGISEDEWASLEQIYDTKLPEPIASFILAITKRYAVVRVAKNHTQLLNSQMKQIAQSRDPAVRLPAEKLALILDEASRSGLGAVLLPRD